MKNCYVLVKIELVEGKLAITEVGAFSEPHLTIANHGEVWMSLYAATAYTYAKASSDALKGIDLMAKDGGEVWAEVARQLRAGDSKLGFSIDLTSGGSR